MSRTEEGWLRHGRISRRRFVTLAALGTSAMALPWHWELQHASAQTEYDGMEWMDGEPVGPFDERTTWFRNRDPRSGATWRWNDVGALAELHPPWDKRISGVAFADIELLVPEASPALEAVVEMRPDAGDGIGITVLVRAEGVLRVAGSYRLTPQDGRQTIRADLSGWAGRQVGVRLQIDNHRIRFQDTVALHDLRVIAADGTAVGPERWRDESSTGLIQSIDLDAIYLPPRRPWDTSIMDRHRHGRVRGANVYSVLDGNRPLFGAHVYLIDAVDPYLPHLSDLLDFASHDEFSHGNRTFELLGMPYVNVRHPNIPLGTWDERRWANVAEVATELEKSADAYRFMLGATTGSEPHISPNYAYTGHTEEEVKGLAWTPESAVDFGAWLADLYGDSSPSEDSNGDGITFADDFGFTADSWDTLGTVMPETGHDVAYLRTLFKEHLITKVITGTDRYATENNSGFPISSRLLNPPYPPEYSVSLRQLRLPSEAIGVTYYTHTLGATPSVSEFNGNYIYQIGREQALRPVYNEFNPLAAEVGTAGIYRAVFRELPYQPAALNWFCFIGGDKNFKPGHHFDFSRLDIEPVADTIAVLRNQLELGQPYASVRRQKSDLGVFLPVACPEPLGNDLVEHVGVTLPRQLTELAPDVFPSDRTDAYSEYKNILLVLGFIDGPTDAFLNDLLSDIPADTKIMIVAATDTPYTEPGRRSSPSWRHSLEPVLPLRMAGGGLTEATLQLVEGTSVPLAAAGNVTRRDGWSHGTWLTDDERTVGWRSHQMLFLAGLPTSGLDDVIADFFGVRPAAVRKEGALHLLNRDAAATEPGWYSVPEGATLQLRRGLMGYDLVTRSPVHGRIGGETVVRALSPEEFEVLDSGTARAQLLERTQDTVSVRLDIPSYPFDNAASPELIIHSAGRPRVYLDDVEQRRVVPRGRRLWQAPVATSGVYRVVRSK